MITYFLTENFKGLKKLEMEGITPLTLVSGRNNVGKTSLLESLFLFHDHSSPDVFAKLSNMRSGFVESTVRLWEPLFYQMSVDRGMSFLLRSGDKKETTLKLRKDMNFVPSASSAPNSDIMGQLLTSVKSSYALEFDYAEDDYTEHGHFSATQAGVLINMDTSLAQNERKPMQWTLLINSSNGRVTQDLVDWIGNLEIGERKDIAIDVLRLISEDIRDIFSASQNGIVQLYIKGKDGVIPLKYAGDGMVRLLYMMAAILSNPNSLILIDEIENGFHYSMYSKLWETLAKISHDNNCQVIATSHSYENIISAVEGVKSVGRIDDFSLHRLDKVDDEIIDNCYNADLVETAIQSNMEVR